MALPPWIPPVLPEEILDLLGSCGRLPELAPRGGDEGARKKLDALASGPQAPAPAVLAGLYLYFDLLDPAHKIAQDISTPTGSFWHGIMHRREPDDDNSAYWFRRVGDHPALKALGPQARSHLDASGEGGLTGLLFKGNAWDPFAFIEACSQARRGGPAGRVTLLRELQVLEWRTLFLACLKEKQPS